MRHVVAMAFVLAAGSSALAADDGVWSVSKSSGEVWVTTTGAAQVSLKQEDGLKAGDTIRTGRNGRVLLVRGEESILISPNSVIGVPAEKKDGMSTTILQQAGSILLEVEKKNVKHFEVETPYLAAVVKGTQFSVTVDGASTRVDVRRGQVEVSDFKSGQIALVLPGQAATSFEHGTPGLSLSGSGQFVPIEHRAKVIQKAYDTTLPGGALIVVEKILGSTSALASTFIDEYHGMKLANGYSADEVAAKAESLEGSLVPVSAEENERMLRAAGFKQVECFWRWMNFAGWVAVK